MSYNLFIDDERFPPDDAQDWIIVRSSQEARDVIVQQGPPNFISFDHDLGGEDTAMKVVQFLIDSHLMGFIRRFPTKYYVHSQNPVGAANIRGLMNYYISTL